MAVGEDSDLFVLDVAAVDFLRHRLRGAGPVSGLGSRMRSTCRLFTDLAIPGWTSHILSASFFGALNALGISMLGEYVIRIYDQVRGRPLYVIDRVVEFKSEPVVVPCLANVEHWEESYDDLLSESKGLLDMVRGGNGQVDLSEAKNAVQLLKLADVVASDRD